MHEINIPLFYIYKFLFLCEENLKKCHFFYIVAQKGDNIEVDIK